jgi:hypothetical protein
MYLYNLQSLETREKKCGCGCKELSTSDECGIRNYLRGDSTMLNVELIMSL